MGKLTAVLRQTRWLFGGITVLLVSPFLLPLWQTRMEAPQYKGEEALSVSVYAGRVIGDLKEIDILNQYVGVRLPLEGAEMNLIPFVFAGLAVFALVATLLPMRLHRPTATVLLVLLLVVGLCGLSVLQYRLYEMGHDRGEEIFEGVDDFTPPVLGHIKVANFDASMRLGLGGWLLVLAVILCAAVVFGGRVGAGELAGGAQPSSEPA